MQRIIFALIFILITAACTPTNPETDPVETVRPSETPASASTLPPATETVRPAVTAVPTEEVPRPIPSPSLTPLPVPSLSPTSGPTAVPSATLEPTPWIAPQGEAFWYLNADTINRYDLLTGETEAVIDTGGWEIESAAMSDYSDGWLAYVDRFGLKLLSFAGGSPIWLSQSEGEWYVRGLLFSPDGRLLAYTDIAGLHIYDLADGSDRLVWENDVEYLNEDPPDLTVYRAMSWSADQNWLTVWIGKWEGGWLEVGSLETGSLYELWGCYNTDWSAFQTRLAMAVRYNSYLGCGGDIDGLYTVEIGPDGIDQRRIYANELPDPNFGMTGIGEVAWSPDGALIAFVQDEEAAPVGRLLLTAPSGSAVQTLVESESGSIRTPVWSRDSRSIYYAENHPGNTDSGTIFVYEIDTGQSRPIYTRADQLAIRERSPDERWLLVSAYNQFRNTNLRLVNLLDGTSIDIETDSEAAWIGWTGSGLSGG